MIVRLLLAVALYALLLPAATYADQCSPEDVVDGSVGPSIAPAGDRATALRLRQVRGLDANGPANDLRIVTLGPGGRVTTHAVDRSQPSLGPALGRVGATVAATWLQGPFDRAVRQLRIGPDPAARLARPPLDEPDPDGNADDERGTFAAHVAGADDGTVVITRMLPATDDQGDGWGGPAPVGQLVRYPADGGPPTVAPLPARDGDDVALAVDRHGRAWAAGRAGGRIRIVRWDPGVELPGQPIAISGVLQQLVADDLGAWAVVRRAGSPRLVRLHLEGGTSEVPVPGARTARIAVAPSGVGGLAADVPSGRSGDGGDVRLHRLTSEGLRRGGRVVARSRHEEAVADVQVDARGRAAVLVQRSGSRAWEQDLLLWRGGRTIPVAARPGRVDERAGALAVLDDGSAWVVHDRHQRSARRAPVCGYVSTGDRWQAVRVSPAGRVTTRRVLPGARPLRREYGG